jgi:hypothetical protein
MAMLPVNFKMRICMMLNHTKVSNEVVYVGVVAEAIHGNEISLLFFSFRLTPHAK